MCILSCTIMSNSLWSHGLYPTGLLCPWDSPWQENWSGLPFPPPADLPHRGSKQRLLSLLHWQEDSLTLYHQENPLYELYANKSFNFRACCQTYNPRKVIFKDLGAILFQEDSSQIFQFLWKSRSQTSNFNGHLVPSSKAISCHKDVRMEAPPLGKDS